METRFTEVYRCDIKKIGITKYRSSKTGLTLTHISNAGPLVSGSISVITEPNTDDGLPHTLEHLVFQGCQQYPYKGFLDLAANQCFASGTNAYTSDDCTVYTMSTIGSQGFLTLLPIFLEHVMFPTLTDQGFVTEVHHVTGEGADAGVVYSEMQARENNCGDRSWRAMRDVLYVEECGYKVDSGGLTHNLRTSCNNSKVREFHRAYYRPENVEIVVDGKIEIGDVFQALQHIDDRMGEVDWGVYEKPWTSPVHLFQESKTIKIQFPSEEEDNGRMAITWKGLPMTSFRETMAHSYIWQYLTSTSASPMVKELVDIDKPYCSSVGSSCISQPQTMQIVVFEGTQRENLDLLYDKFMSVMRETAQAPLDMGRIQNLIKNNIYNTLDALENGSTGWIGGAVLCDQIYGDGTHNILSAIPGVLDRMESLKEESEEFWRELIKYYLSEPCITVISEPSAQCMKELEKQEEERVKLQKEALGEAGIKECAEKLQAAIEFNERKFDYALLDALPKPSLNSNIDFYEVKTTREPVDGVFLHQIESDFIRFYFCLDASKLTPDYKQLFDLYCWLFGDTSVKRGGGEIMSYEDVIKERERLFISSSCGTDGYAYVTMGFKFLKQDLAECKVFMRDLMCNRVFTADRVDTTVKQIISDIKIGLREAPYIQSALCTIVRYSGGIGYDTNAYTIKHLFEEHKDNLQYFTDKLQELQELLFNDNNIVLHIIASQPNLDSLSLPELVDLFNLSKSQYPQIKPTLYKRPPDQPIAVLKTVPSDESSYVKLYTDSFEDEHHVDDPVVDLLAEYLGQSEGPLWQEIRGPGYSYSYGIFNSTYTGSMGFDIYKASHAGKAFTAARDVIKAISGGTLDNTRVGTAKGVMVYNTLSCISSPVSTAFSNITYIELGLPPDRMMTKLDKILAVQGDDLVRVGKEYFTGLFTQPRYIVVCCHPNKKEEIVQEFEKVGFKIDIVEDVYQYMLQLQGS